MLAIKALQAKGHSLRERLNDLKQQIGAIAGEQYRGCWLDSTQNRKGTTYKRLHWFKDVATNQKGCRTLKADEVARAEQASRLWSEVEQLQNRFDWLEQEIGKLQSRIA